jgi:hypothetical protein
VPVTYRLASENAAVSVTASVHHRDSLIA